MPEQVEVQPADLRRGAAQLRDDAGRLEACLAQLASGADATANAAGAGPLEGATGELAARLTTLIQAVGASVAECADALDAASTRYLTTDEGAAAGLGTDGAPPITLPGLEPPRWRASTAMLGTSGGPPTP